MPCCRAIAEERVPKGEVLAVARVAGILAAKRTGELIPLCHPIGLDLVDVVLTPRPGDGFVHIRTECRVHGRTGIEMEALTAATVAALTIYDMCKAVDRAMRIESVELVSKEGGKSGDWRRD